ncbi:toxin, partial [Morganella morganii]
ALVRTDRHNNGITATDILRARKATGLITRRSSHIARRHCTV